MTIIWCMVPEIRSMTDIIFLSFWTIFCPFTPYGPRKSKQILKNGKKHLKIAFSKHKWQSYDVWFLRDGVQETDFFVILDHFSSFYPPNNPKNQHSKKWNKHLEILFYTSAILSQRGTKFSILSPILSDFDQILLKCLY